MPSSRRFEIAAVILTGLLKFVCINWLNWKLPFIVGAGGFWLGYIIWRVRQEPSLLTYWGFGKKNLKQSFLALGIFGAVAVSVFYAYGTWQGSMIMNWHILPILALYPIWGMIQQFLMMSLVAGNLHDMEAGIPKGVVIGITAVAFSIVHLPFPFLTLGTFLLALFYAPLYLKYRNLWALGIFHGWLGALFFFWVMGRDPWVEILEIFR